MDVKGNAMAPNEAEGHASRRDGPVLEYRKLADEPVRASDVVGGAVAIVAALLLGGLTVLATLGAVYDGSAVLFVILLLCLAGTLLALRVAWERLVRRP